MTTDPRPEWLLMSAFDREFCCPWCPYQASIRPLLAAHKRKCTSKPKTEEAPMGASEKAAATYHPSTVPAVAVDSAHLLTAMRDRLTEAESGIGDPDVSQTIAIATADAFGTVIDWFEDTYLPGVLRG